MITPAARTADIFAVALTPPAQGNRQVSTRSSSRDDHSTQHRITILRPCPSGSGRTSRTLVMSRRTCQETDHHA